MKDCIFCKIVKGEIPCYKIFENDRFFVFLDAFPSMRGQVLVIPKEHVGGYLFKLRDNDYSDLMILSKRVAESIDSSLLSERTCMVVEGMEVNHVHVKLYPIFKGDSLNLSGHLNFSAEEMNEMARKISNKMVVDNQNL